MVSTSQEAAARWQHLIVPAALSKQDAEAAAELLASGVAGERVAALYPADFTALMNHLAAEVAADSRADDVEDRLIWYRLELRLQEETDAPPFDFFVTGSRKLVAGRLMDMLNLDAMGGGYEDEMLSVFYCLCAACWLMATTAGTTSAFHFFCTVANLLLPGLREVEA